MKKKFRLTDKQVAAMKKQGVPVPSSLKELRQLLKEGEESGPFIPVDQAFQEIRAELSKRWGRENA